MRYMQFIMRCKAKEPSEFSGASIRARKKARNNTNLSTWEIHHIVPRSKGGTNRADNLICLTPLDHCVAHMIYAQESNEVDSGASVSCWSRAARSFSTKKDLERAVMYVANNATISKEHHQGFDRVYRKYFRDIAVN